MSITTGVYVAGMLVATRLSEGIASRGRFTRYEAVLAGPADVAKAGSFLRSIFRDPGLTEPEQQRVHLQPGDRRGEFDDEEQRLLRLLLLYH